MHQHFTASLIRKTLFFLTTTLLAGMALSVILSPVARAAEFDVGCNVADLIQAITDANGNGQPDTINLAADCTYTLTAVNNNNDGPNGLPSITSPITINGSGATIERSSGDDFRIFHVASGGDLTLTDITIANGNLISDHGGGIYNTGTLNLSNSALSDNTANRGGGIYNTGTLDISNSTLSGNTATIYGGGIHNTGTLDISNSTLSDNTTIYGSGIYNEGEVNLSNSTLSGNTAASRGGVYNKGTLNLSNSTLSDNTANHGGGIYNKGTLNLSNSTLSSNTASYGGGIFNNGGTLDISNNTVYSNTATAYTGGVLDYDGALDINNITLSVSTDTGGGGIYNNAGTTSITNTIVAGNTDLNCAGAITSGGYNVESANTCGLGATGDVTNSTTITTTLGPLADNGGDTQTHALLEGSPAIDHIPNTTNGCGTTYTTDQRGYIRPYPTDASCDIGAYEGALFGDHDYDGDVDVEDIMLVAGRWRCRSGDACYNERYDLDRDGDIDIVDIMLVVARWQDTWV